jgi:hypothetical protein
MPKITDILLWPLDRLFDALADRRALRLKRQAPLTFRSRDFSFVPGDLRRIATLFGTAPSQMAAVIERERSRDAGV